MAKQKLPDLYKRLERSGDDFTKEYGEKLKIHISAVVDQIFSA